MRSQGSGWRARRREAVVSHYPPPSVSPVMGELLGGRSPRQLTRAQRREIVRLLQGARSFDEPWLRADVRAVAEGVEQPTRRLLGLLRAAQPDLPKET